MEFVEATFSEAIADDETLLVATDAPRKKVPSTDAPTSEVANFLSCLFMIFNSREAVMNKAVRKNLVSLGE